MIALYLTIIITWPGGIADDRTFTFDHPFTDESCHTVGKQVVAEWKTTRWMLA